MVKIVGTNSHQSIAYSSDVIILTKIPEEINKIAKELFETENRCGQWRIGSSQ